MSLMTKKWENMTPAVRESLVSEFRMGVAGQKMGMDLTSDGDFWVPEAPEVRVRGRFTAGSGREAEVLPQGAVVDDPRVRPTGGGVAFTGAADDWVQSFLPITLHGQLDTGEPVTLLNAQNYGGDGARFGNPRYVSHPRPDCVWEYQQPLAPRNNGAEATYFWKSDQSIDTPDLQAGLAEFPLSSAENEARFDVPQFGWTLCGGVVRPQSRGHISLTGPDPSDAVQIEANMLSHPADLKGAITCVQLSREIGNSAALRPFTKREVMPGNLKGAELERYVRDAALTWWHQTCTAKMGQDAMSVVDGELKVYGISHLRIADGSIMPRVTTGNTMAPCVIIGERAAQILQAHHTL
jgi:hypothetical protein